MLQYRHSSLVGFASFAEIMAQVIITLLYFSSVVLCIRTVMYVLIITITLCFCPLLCFDGSKTTVWSIYYVCFGRAFNCHLYPIRRKWNFTASIYPPSPLQIFCVAVLLYTPLICSAPIVIPIISAYCGVITRCVITLGGFYRLVYPKLSKNTVVSGNYIMICFSICEYY